MAVAKGLKEILVNDVGASTDNALTSDPARQRITAQLSSRSILS
jgi:hypothetical protein